MKRKVKQFKVTKMDADRNIFLKSRIYLDAESHCDAHLKYCEITGWDGQTETVAIDEGVSSRW